MSVSLGKESRISQTVKGPTRIPGGPSLSVTAAPKHLTPHSPLYSEVVVALAPALDALGGNEDGHVLRTVVIGMQIGGLLDLGQLAASDLFYALLLKDIGAAGARAQRFHSYGNLSDDMARMINHADLTDLSQTVPLTAAILKGRAPLRRRLRSVSDLVLGSRRQATAVVRAGSRVAASLALEMGFSHGTAAALRSQTERWDGRGRPDGLSGEAIPVASRIVAVAEELDLLLSNHTPAAAITRLELEAGRRFDPVIVKLAERLIMRGRLLDQLADDDLEQQVLDQEPMQRRHVALAGRVDRLLTGIGRLIDSRSSWRTRHTERVKQLAVGAALSLPLPHRLGISSRRRLARAALLHDVGKISTPVSLHDQPRALTEQQLRELQGDTKLVDRVLHRVLDLADAALVTETFVMGEIHSHDDVHSRPLDLELEGHLMSALVSLADRFEALLSPRPQRAGKSAAEALAVLRQDVEERLRVYGEDELVQKYEGVDPWDLALTALEAYVASPSAASLLVPRKFDADAIVVVD
ncbi:MAG: HD domain-containing phosphohydrolase [Trueperaceae bacterium]